MKPTHRIGARALVLLGCLLAAFFGCYAQEDRITGPINFNRTAIIKDVPHSMVAPANDRGALDPATPVGSLRMALRQTAAQTKELEQLLEAQRNPASSDYQRWLTPEEYGQRFGVSQNDLARITSWLQSEGFTIQQVARASNWVSFRGAAGQIARTFRTELHRYEAGGEAHFANAAPASIPAALADIVSELHGLNDFHPKPPRNRKIKPAYTTSGGVHYLAPDDLATIYDITPLYKAGFDGTGQRLAIAGQTDIDLADIRNFRAEFGLVAKDPQLILYGTDPGVSAGDRIEADLDLEWSGAVARNASIIYVYSQDVFESLQYAIDQNIASVISMSYGECESGAPASYRAMAQQANAEGMTWMNSSGDGGAAGCDWDAEVAVNGPSVVFPADIPEVTAVGGTEFHESGTAGWSSQNSAAWGSATGYLPEMAWNDTALGNGIWATGGGASVLFGKPWWQNGTGVPDDSARDVPDISLAASGDHDGYLIYAEGGLMAVGGTSASSPSFAGIVTLLNQYLVAKGTQSKPGLGNINPNLYTLANTTGAIHDITSGNNIVPCKRGSTGCTTGSFGFTAGVGYDPVTGLGSVDAYNLVTRWSTAPVAIGTTMTLAASPTSLAQSATVQLTAKITAVTGSAGPAGTVTFTAGGVSLGSAAATVSGTSSTATLSVKGSSLSAGSESIAASFAPAGAFSCSGASVTVTVTGLPVATKTNLAANPGSIAAAGTTQLTATVTPVSGNALPAGSVTFSAGSATLGSATLTASGSAALSVPGSRLTARSNSITASYAGSVGFTASVSPSITVTVAAPLIATTTAIAANPSSIAQGASTVLAVTVKPASGIVPPTGSVTFTVQSAALGSATLTASGAGATATLTVKAASLAPGSDVVTASYDGDSKNAASTGTVTVSVAAPLVATTTIIAALPATIAHTATTQLTALVKPASGTALPGGTVSFAIGGASLGSAPVTVAAGMASATLSVAGSKLNIGRNNISASYSGSAGFTACTASVIVIVN